MDKKKNFILLLTFLFVISCGSSETSIVEEPSSVENIGNNEQTNTNNENEQTTSNNELDSSVDKNTEKEKVTEKANLEEVLEEFPQGALSFLSDKEQQCIAEISTTESLRSMEKSLMEEGKILQEQMDYFTACNLPGPPGIGIKEATSSVATESLQETSYSTSFASIENIRSLGEDGVSPHLEKVDEKTLRLFYSSIKVR